MEEYHPKLTYKSEPTVTTILTRSIRLQRNRRRFYSDCNGSVDDVGSQDDDDDEFTVAQGDCDDDGGVYPGAVDVPQRRDRIALVQRTIRTYQLHFLQET